MDSFGLQYLINETTRKTDTTESCIHRVYVTVKNKHTINYNTKFKKLTVCESCYFLKVYVVGSGIRGF